MISVWLKSKLLRCFKRDFLSKSPGRKSIGRFSVARYLTKVLIIPGLESLGDDNILNKAASLKAVTKLRSSSFRVGVLTLANAKRQEGKSMPWKEISRV